MTQQPKLSKAQRRVVGRMERYSDNQTWWSAEQINVRQSTLDVLERKGVLSGHHERGDLWYKLNAEAERVPIEDLDIPF